MRRNFQDMLNYLTFCHLGKNNTSELKAQPTPIVTVIYLSTDTDTVPDSPERVSWVILDHQRLRLKPVPEPHTLNK